MTIRCEVLPLKSFDSVRADWAMLARRYGQAPFLDVDFVEALIDCYATGAEKLVRLSDSSQVLALGIFAPRSGMWETFQPSQMPLGCLVAREGVEWGAQLAAIGRAMPGFALGVAASQQDPLFFPRPPSQGALTTLDYVATAAIDVSGSFEDYWNARGKNLRQNLRKQRRKLVDEGHAPTLDVVTSIAEVPQALADYARLETAGWKSGGGTAIGADNEQQRFYTRVLETYCARGRGRILRYRIGERVAAVDLCIESEDCLVILKTTYDETMKSCSPASLMHEDAFRGIWEEGRIRRIEFYGRVMEWHTRWTEQVRTLYHVNWYRWPMLTQVAARVARRIAPRAKDAAIRSETP